MAASSRRERSSVACCRTIALQPRPDCVPEAMIISTAAPGSFLRDHWCVGAWSDEVSEKPLARTLLGEGIVFYRNASGKVVALEDRCAHRRLPLSMGIVIGDTIQCGYHGLVYDCAGKCIKIPGQEGVPAGIGVRCYPVAEHHQFVSVWMGDPALADESAAIGFPRLGDPGWAHSKVRLEVGANFLLIIDNLLDLSHVAYVHNSTIGNRPLAENAPPGYFLINNGCAAPNSGADDDSRLAGPGEWGFQVYHCITPQDERRTHQFWAIAYDNATVAAKDRPEFNRQHHHVIAEDVAIYEAQQRALDDSGNGVCAEDIRSSVVIPADAGLLHARRMIARLRDEARI